MTLDQMVLCRAVRRGVTRALVSCDVPFGPLQDGPDAAVRAPSTSSRRVGRPVKLDPASSFPDAVRPPRAGIPVWAQFGTPHRLSARGNGRCRGRHGDEGSVDRRGEAPGGGGASLLDFTNSGPVAGPEVAARSDPGDRHWAAARARWSCSIRGCRDWLLRDGCG